MSFQLWPALDLLDGRVVRLRQGDYDAVTHYEDTLDDLLATAQRFAHGLHIVDLDGARDGQTGNAALLDAILDRATVPVEIGGGVRTEDDIERLLYKGAARVILGSRAVEDPPFVTAMVARFGPGRIVAGADLKDGKPAVRGWLDTADLTADTFLDQMVEAGVETVIVTDVSTDGMMQGPNTALIKRLAAAFPSLDVIASGGVASVTDLDALRQDGAAGAVIGKAWLDGAISADDLLAFSTRTA